jgi:hypothetical protein
LSADALSYLERWATRNMITIGLAQPLLPTAARSYLADGQMVQWAPPASPLVRVAMDAELACQAVPATLAGRFGASDPALFWPRWTQIETACKLENQSIMVWLKREGFTRPRRCALTTFTVNNVVVTCGAVATAHYLR